MKVRASIELRCKRNLEISPEIHCEAVFLVPGQEEKVVQVTTLADESELSCVVAEIEDFVAEIDGVAVGEWSVTGLEAWEWEKKR